MRTLKNIQGFPMSLITSEIFILIILYPSKFNLGKAECLFWFDNFFPWNFTMVTYQKKKLIISGISLFKRWKNKSLWFSKLPLGNLKIDFSIKDILKHFFSFFLYFYIWIWFGEGKNQEVVRGELDIWLRWDQGCLKTTLNYLYNQNSDIIFL